MQHPLTVGCCRPLPYQGVGCVGGLQNQINEGTAQENNTVKLYGRVFAEKFVRLSESNRHF